MAIQSTVIGNLAADCEQVTLGQTQALKFRVGSTRSRKDKEGNKVTDWVQVTYFKTQLAQYLTKGTKVAVFGELEVNPWTSQQGQVNVGLQMVANAIEFVGSKQDGQQQQQPTQQPVQQPAQQPQFPPPPPTNDNLPF